MKGLRIFEVRSPANALDRIQFVGWKGVLDVAVVAELKHASGLLQHLEPFRLGKLAILAVVVTRTLKYVDVGSVSPFRVPVGNMVDKQADDELDQEENNMSHFARLFSPNRMIDTE